MSLGKSPSSNWGMVTRWGKKSDQIIWRREQGLEAKKSSWIGLEPRRFLLSVPFANVDIHSDSDLNISWGGSQGCFNSRSRWLLKACCGFRVVGQIVFSVKAEKNKIGIQLTDRDNMARMGYGWGSESSPQAQTQTQSRTLLLGRGCCVLLAPPRLGSGPGGVKLQRTLGQKGWGY